MNMFFFLLLLQKWSSVRVINGRVINLVLNTGVWKKIQERTIKGIRDQWGLIGGKVLRV